MTRIIALIVSAVLLTASATAQEEETDVWDRNLESLKELGSFNARGRARAVTWEEGGRINAMSAHTRRRFTVGSTRGRIGADLGCDGLDFDSLMEGAFADDLDRQVDQLIEEAPGFLIGWLIYSNPTLAELIDNLRGDANLRLDAAMVSCRDARRFAEEHPFDYGPAQAESDCISAEGDPHSCMNAEDIAEPLQEKARELLREAKCMLTTSTGGIVDAGCEGDSGETLTAEEAEDKQCYADGIEAANEVSYTNLILSRGSFSCASFDQGKSMIPNYVLNAEENPTWVVRDRDVEGPTSIYLYWQQLVDEWVTDFDRLVTLHDLINGPEKASTSSAAIEEEYDEIFLKWTIRYSGPPIADEYLRRARTLQVNNRELYENFRLSSGQMIARNVVFNLTREFQAGVLSAIAHTDEDFDSKVPPEVTEGLLATAERWEAEVQWIDQRFQQQEQVQSFYNETLGPLAER